MPTSDLTAELLSLLHEEREVSDRLLVRLDRDAEPVEVVSLLESLALLDQRRARVLTGFRAAASSTRQRTEERSIRQFVLRALEEIGVPQTTGFLEDYLYARELLVLKTRGMGALRRDEYRAWGRLRDRPRTAYAVPCLDESGRAISRWMARSDWPLEKRIAVEGAEELWGLHRVRALIDAYREGGPDADPLFLPLIERYEGEAFGEESPPDDLADKDRLPDLERRCATRIAALEAKVGPRQRKAAKGLAGQEEEQQLWGLRGR